MSKYTFDSSHSHFRCIPISDDSHHKRTANSAIFANELMTSRTMCGVLLVCFLSMMCVCVWFIVCCFCVHCGEFSQMLNKMRFYKGHQQITVIFYGAEREFVLQQCSNQIKTTLYGHSSKITQQQSNNNSTLSEFIQENRLQQQHTNTARPSTALPMGGVIKILLYCYTISRMRQMANKCDNAINTNYGFSWEIFFRILHRPCLLSCFLILA